MLRFRPDQSGQNLGEGLRYLGQVDGLNAIAVRLER